MRFVITAQHLFLMFAARATTMMDVYPLPKTIDITTPRRLAPSHKGAYSHAISSIQVIDDSSSSSSEDIRISFLSLVYIRPSPTNWTSKIGLYLFDADLDITGSVNFTSRCHRTLDVGIATTLLSLTSRGENCLAITHSSPGPVILAHHIHRPSDSDCVMNVKTLKLPEGIQSRDMLDFDGIKGRLCLITGWTNIDIVDYV